MSYLIREIKISKFTKTPLSDEASKFIKFWGRLCNDMKIHVDNNKGEIRCCKDGYGYYFLQDGKNDYFWCDSKNVWSFFEEELDINYKETQELIQYMVNKTLNLVINTPDIKFATLPHMNNGEQGIKPYGKQPLK